MKFSDWLGWNDESSPYLLKRGELRSLVNLQPVRRGMLTTRAGMLKMFGEYDAEAIMGMYRKATPFGTADIILILQRAVRKSDDPNVPDTPIWRVSRITGSPFQSQMIDEQLVVPVAGGTSIANMSIAEDRFGRLFIFYGHGAEPVMYRPGLSDVLGVTMGLAEPTIAPTVVPEGEGYFIERVDITSSGGSYWGPPSITVDGGDPKRNAILKGVVQGGNLISVDVIDGGFDFKTFPTLTIGRDKSGSGFRGVGVLENDPGIQGFVESVPGVVNAAKSPFAGETFGLNNLLNGNRILYLSSPLVRNTTATAGASNVTMNVGSVVGVQVGDLVTLRATGATTPPPFDSPNSLVRVVGITSSNTAHTVTLSKPWTATAGVTYQVQFRRDWSLDSVPATYDAKTNLFRAALPLTTRSGVGHGAEATITFSPLSDGYALGPFAQQDFITPTGGPEESKFAYRSVGWDNYEAFGNDYWKGGEPFPADGSIPSSNLKEYTGLQASGSRFVYGYTGAVTSRTGRRGDVYWPDYSELSVWVCTGQYDSNIRNWKRVDAKVYDGNTSQPYVLVTLEPALKGVGEPPSTRRGLRRPVQQNSPGFSSSKQRGRQPAVSYKKTDDYKPPVVKIKLKPCPDSWLTNYTEGGSYNLPSWLKNADANKLPWWNSSAVTPRPLVDFQGSQPTVALDFGTVEVVDPGSGWEKGTTFAIRFYQANPYVQINDFNYRQREEARPTTGGRRNRNRAHAAFSATTRYREFLFKATLPDASRQPGPPAEIVGAPGVDVGGTNYRAGDVAAVTLVKRATTADYESRYFTFTGYFSTTGSDTEYNRETSTLTGTYSRPANSNILTVTLPAAHGLVVGDRVRLDFTSGTAQDGDYNVRSVDLTTFSIEHQFASGAIGTTGNVQVILSPFPRRVSAASIVRVEGGTLSTSIMSGSIIKCTTPGVLYDFTQVRQAMPSLGHIRTDKACYPLPRIIEAVSCTVANVNDVISAQAATRIDGVPLSVTVNNVTTSIESLIQVGRRVWFTVGAQLQYRGATILRIDRTEGSSTVSLWVTGTATGTGSTSFRWAFEFEIFSGAAESQTIEWTATQIVPGENTQKVTSVRVLSPGRNFYTPPAIDFSGGGQGYGLDVKAEVADGKVTSITVLDPGRDWTAPPELFTSDVEATAVPVMRPALRGKYRCAYRYADRSETVLKTVLIAGVDGRDPVNITVTDGSDIKPGMVIESELVPFGTRVVSVTGNSLKLNQSARGKGELWRVEIESKGSGYAQGETVTATLPTKKPTDWEGDWPTPNATFSVTLEKDPAGEFQVRSATVTSPGTNLYPPGRVPLVFSQPASGIGVPAMGYAYIGAFEAASDKSATIRDMTKPVSYSNFSPIEDVDAGPDDTREHSAKMVWSLPGVKPPARADLVEFYRTSADQTLVFYRLEMYGLPTSDGIRLVGEDTLTDEELFDPDRPNYAALPVLLPNGGLNAYRFGVPRKDMSACVSFQDRLWYGVSTSGKDSNTVFYSEYDEFESCPDANELPIQNNFRTTDSLTALAPFGGMLLAMQNSHTYAVTYNTDPGIDAAVQLISHRGCLNQRCWDIYENTLFAADETGIYSMTRSGEVNNLSMPIRNFFSEERLDFANRETFHLKVCEKTRVLRLFCSLAEQPTTTPSIALCFHIEQQTWWVEKYPNSICSAVSARPSPLRPSSTVYGCADGNIYELSGNSDVGYRSIVSVTVTGEGAGYTDPPKVTARNGQGAEFQAIISEGRLTEILVLAGGWGYFQSPSMLSQDGNYITTEDGFRITYGGNIPVQLDIEPPPANGPALLTEDGRPIIAQNGARIRQGDDFPASAIAVTSDPMEIIETANFAAGSPNIVLNKANPAIVPGMEVFSPHLPLGAVVRSVNNRVVVLWFPDKTPSVATATINSGVVRFYGRYQTHIPYLLSTGNLEIANDSNVPRGGDTLIDRSITVLYSPTQSNKYLELLEYYNDGKAPRPNVHRRNRGGSGGFQHKQDSASTVLNMSKTASHLGNATGMAKATFAGNSSPDLVGTDRHLRVALYGRPSPANGAPGDLTPEQVKLHSLTVDGVVENA